MTAELIVRMALVGVLMAPVLAGAHENYPPMCCNGDGQSGDCHPVSCDSIAETKTGYQWQRFFFKPEQAHPSFDTRCHVCIYRGTAPQCVFIQPSS